MALVGRPSCTLLRCDVEQGADFFPAPDHRSLWHPSHRLLDITPPSTLDFKIKKLEIRKSHFKL
jgi:hypothetical protein